MKTKTSLIQSLLMIMLISLALLLFLSTTLTTYSVARPGSFIYELKQCNNQLDYPEMHISIDDWRKIPPGAQRTILLRQNIAGPIYLLFCFIFVLLLRRAYKIIINKQQYSLASAKVRLLGFLPVLYVTVNFIITLILNLGVYNLSKKVSGMDVGSRHIPEFNFELFIFGVIIMIFADIYIQISAIKDDLELTV